LGELTTILVSLQKRDYKSAFKITSRLLDEHRNDSLKLKPVLIYMNILSAAGLVSENKSTHSKFLSIANQFVGQNIESLPYKCVDSSVITFGSFKFHMNQNGTYGEVVSSNPDATSIFIFEKYFFTETFSKNDYIGKYIIAAGTLDSIEINENLSTIWISRMSVKNTILRTLEIE
jgi:hypothetical protein